MKTSIVSLVFVYMAVLPLLFPFVSPAADQSVLRLKETARKYYYGDGVPRDYKAALSLYLKAAAQGDAEAQYIAGGMFFKGMGTGADYARAFRLLHEAAQNGKSTVESEKILAQSFLLGQEVPKNYEEAVRWFSKAAEGGDSEAQNELAFMYYTGNGIEQDLTKAYDFFMDAALQGYVLAQYNLGIMLYTGQGVEQADLVKSYGWFSIAAANGHEQAVQARNFLETVLSREELGRAQKFAESIYQR